MVMPHEVLGITAWEFAEMKFRVEYAEAVAMGKEDLAEKIKLEWNRGKPDHLEHL